VMEDQNFPTESVKFDVKHMHIDKLGQKTD
jgi:hypothetical protein